MRRILSLLALLSRAVAGRLRHPRSGGDTLTTTLDAYASALRWGDVRERRAVRRSQDPRRASAEPSWQIARIQAGAGQRLRRRQRPDSRLAEQRCSRPCTSSLVNIHTQSERTIVDHQTWHYDEKTESLVAAPAACRISPRNPELGLACACRSRRTGIIVGLPEPVPTDAPVD